MQHILVTVAEQQLMIHWKVCSKGTGSSSWCKLALKAIVEQTILYYYLPYGQRLLQYSILWGICSIRTAFIALCTEQMSTLCYTMVLNASLHKLLDPVPFEQTFPCIMSCSLVPIRKLVPSTDRTQYPHGESNVWTLCVVFVYSIGISTEPIKSQLVRKIT